MLYVGECPVCAEGTLGIRLCGSCQAAFVLCDECDALWLEPRLLKLPHHPSRPEVPCPQCDASLHQPPSRWADETEVDQRGWTPYVAGSTKDD